MPLTEYHVETPYNAEASEMELPMSHGIPAKFAWSMASTAATEYQARIETLWLRLAAVAVGSGAPDRMDFLKEEVQRRLELFTKVRVESPRGGESPYAAAIQSVTSDVERGYLL